jgi:hypothetical protein
MRGRGRSEGGAVLGYVRGMKLRGAALRRLQEALLEGFPTPRDLAQLVRVHPCSGSREDSSPKRSDTANAKTRMGARPVQGELRAHASGPDVVGILWLGCTQRGGCGGG